MKKLFVLLLLIAGVAGVAWFEPSGTFPGLVRGEKFLDGKASSVWARGLVAEDGLEQKRVFDRLEELKDLSIPMLTDLLDHADAQVRWRSADLIGKIGVGTQGTSKKLGKMLADSDEHVKTVAMRALSSIGGRDAEAVAVIEGSLAETDPLSALRALGQIGPPAAKSTSMVVPFLKSESRDVRQQAATTLGQFGPAALAGVDPLIETLSDSDAKVREHAAESLGQIGPGAANAVPALMRAAADSDARVRRDAIRSLGQIGPAAMASLEVLDNALANDSVERVRIAAKTAIESIRAK